MVDYVLKTVLAWEDPYDAARMTPAASGLPQEAVDMLYVSLSGLTPLPGLLWFPLNLNTA